MSRRSFLLTTALVLASLFAHTAAADQFLRGRVLDLQFPASNPHGIDGVRVAVKWSGQTIGTGVTDGDGNYEIKLLGWPPATVKPSMAMGWSKYGSMIAEFKKVNHYDDPTTILVADPSKKQSPVWMAASKMRDDYYNRVGSNVIAQRDEHLRRAQLGIVAALPAEDQAKVVATFTAQGDQSMLSDLERVRSTRTVLVKYRQLLEKENFWSVDVSPMYLPDGKLWVYGTVASEAQQKRLREASIQMIPARQLDFEVTVVPRLANVPNPKPRLY